MSSPIEVRQQSVQNRALIQNIDVAMEAVLDLEEKPLSLPVFEWPLRHDRRIKAFMGSVYLRLQAPSTAGFDRLFDVYGRYGLLSADERAPRANQKFAVRLAHNVRPDTGTALVAIRPK